MQFIIEFFVTFELRCIENHLFILVIKFVE